MTEVKVIEESRKPIIKKNENGVTILACPICGAHIHHARCDWVYGWQKVCIHYNSHWKSFFEKEDPELYALYDEITRSHFLKHLLDTGLEREKLSAEDIELLQKYGHEEA